MEFKKVELKQYLECAKIVNTHGVKGALKLECYADSPETLAKLRTLFIKKGEEYTPMKVESASVQKTMVLCKLEGIDSVEAAISLKNTVLYAERSAFRLRRGDFFIADVIGLDVIDDEKGCVYGTLREVLSPAGQQVYVVERADKKAFMIPCVPDFIKEVSFGDERDAGIYVTLIDGMEDITL